MFKKLEQIKGKYVLNIELFGGLVKRGNDSSFIK